MADFPVTDVINSNISRETLFPSREGFGVLMIAGITDVIDQGERIRFYSDPTSAAADFASTDEELIALNTAFAQEPRPTQVAVGRILSADAPGYVRGSALGLLATFTAISDGSFAITIDGNAEDITGLDFTSDNDFNDVAATIEAGIQAIATGGFTAALVTVEDNRMRITSGTITDIEPMVPVDPATGTDISGPTLCNLTLNASIVIPAHAFTDFTGELQAIQARNSDWFGMSLTRDLQLVQNQLDAAAFAETNGKLFAAFDDSLIGKDPLSTVDLPFQLDALNLNRTFCHWNNDGTKYAEVSEIVRIMTVDYNVPNSAITLKFKRLPTIPVVNVTPSERVALLAKTAEIYVSRSGITMIEEGKVSIGEFIDVIHSTAWMEDEIAIQVFGILAASATKIAMTDEGVAQLEDAVRGVLDIALAAGIIAQDVDDEGELLPAYIIASASVLSLPASQRAARIAPPITWSARLAGAIHFSTINGTVTV